MAEDLYDEADRMLDMGFPNMFCEDDILLFADGAWLYGSEFATSFEEYPSEPFEVIEAGSQKWNALHEADQILDLGTPNQFVSVECPF